ncbi:hypothetical protein NT26_p10114 (plasmid) [Pseudorhizobium banfieldiae]|uniref:Uncharacterized protein n=1 Tax=Pseudorhizobium banfieldiae TaxID=1125847 RepID=L0NMP8_9HYPH|nr:hypothetical protein NT26_p10114 [Pseudorhizobium banfieldiae]
MASEIGNTVLEPSISTVGACCAKEGATRTPSARMPAAEEAKAARAARKFFVLCVMTTLSEFRKAERDIRERRVVIVLFDDSFMSTKYRMAYPDKLIFALVIYYLDYRHLYAIIVLNVVSTWAVSTALADRRDQQDTRKAAAMQSQFQISGYLVIVTKLKRNCNKSLGSRVIEEPSRCPQRS